jgi:hypothetical protein
MSRDIQKERDVLSANGIGLATWAVLVQLSYGPNHLEYCAAQAGAIDDDPLGLVNESECTAAAFSIIDRGWAVITTVNHIKSVHERLGRDRVFGPVYRMPEIGDLDFTQSGAQFMEGLLCDMRPWTEPRRASVVYEAQLRQNNRMLYCSSKGVLEAEVERQKLNSVHFLRTSHISAIGPWCAYWWRVERNGYSCMMWVDSVAIPDGAC